MDTSNALTFWVHCYVQRYKWSYNLLNKASWISAQMGPFPFRRQNLIRLHNDATTIWNRLGVSMLLQADNSLSGSGQQQTWQLTSLISEKGKNVALRKSFPSHANRSAVTAAFLKVNKMLHWASWWHPTLPLWSPQAFQPSLLCRVRNSKPSRGLKKR